MIRIALAGILSCGAWLSGADLVISGCRVYASPGAAPITNATVVVRDGRIAAVGPHGRVAAAPTDATIIDANGLTLTAGFWNSHVHFTEPKWENAAQMPAAQLERQLSEMLTRYGFVSVLDTASFIENTLVIRRRIESGEVAGPRIRTAGLPIAPEGGSPYYVKPVQLPEVQSPKQGAAMVRERVEAGSDAIKIFTVSWPERGRTVAMPASIVKAIGSEAHRLGKPLIAHPSLLSGVELAVEGGVDIVLHSIEGGKAAPELIARMKRQSMALIPTLALFDGDPVAVEFVRLYAAAGGQILFGTDIGFLTEYDTAREFELMAKAGLDYRAILKALTTAPAQRFGSARRAGTVAPGMDADLVLLEGDPAQDVRAFARVKYTIRGGRVIYAAGRG